MPENQHNSENPFEEEFDKKDVVNPEEPETRSKDKSSETEVSQEDFNADELLEDYSEQVKSQKFQPLTEQLEKTEGVKSINKSDESLTKQETLKRDYQDSLLLKKIEGDLYGYSDTNLIPSEILKDSGEKIEIEDEPIISEMSPTKKKPTVLFHRNERDEIEYIEAICSCGEKIVIKLDYEKVESEKQSVPEKRQVDKSEEESQTEKEESSETEETSKDAEESSEESSEETEDAALAEEPKETETEEKSEEESDDSKKPEQTESQNEGDEDAKASNNDINNESKEKD